MLHFTKEEVVEIFNSKGRGIMLLDAPELITKLSHDLYLLARKCEVDEEEFDHEQLSGICTGP